MKTKRKVLRLAVILGLLALLVMPASPASTDNAVSIVVTDTQVPENSDFIAWVNIDNVTDFDAAQYDVTYDPTVIEVTGVTSGLIGTETIPVVDSGFIPTGVQGTIRIINNVDGTPGVTGGGYLAEIHFHVIGATGETSDVLFSNGILGDNEANEITPVTWTNGDIEVITVVTADFYANKTEVLVGQSIAFTDNSTGGSGVYTYDWDFGDTVGTSTLANPTYSYAATGTYTVSLTVTDTSDGSDIETKTGYITVYDALVAGASSDIDEAVVGEDIDFTSSVTGGKPGYTYDWDFGDGVGTSTLASPTYSYTPSGPYTVTLTVTDSLGNTDVVTVDVTIYKLGDADGNGTVQANDLTYIERIIMGDPAYDQTSWADANQDEDWTAIDLTAVELIIMTP